METGHFYFLNDNYFKDFTDTNLMQNKESLNGTIHDRPCFYAFQDSKTGIFWMIPFSSQVNKYRRYYNQKVSKYGNCDTIAFGKILGYEKAFLIQNMCPVSSEYIKNEYFDSQANVPVRIDGVFEKGLIKRAKKVLALQRKGIKLVFPDILEIESRLLKK